MRLKCLAQGHNAVTATRARKRMLDLENSMQTTRQPLFTKLSLLDQPLACPRMICIKFSLQNLYNANQTGPTSYTNPTCFPHLMLRMSGVKCGVNVRNLRLLNNSGEPNMSSSCSLRVSDE